MVNIWVIMPSYGQKMTVKGSNMEEHEVENTMMKICKDVQDILGSIAETLNKLITFNHLLSSDIKDLKERVNKLEEDNGKTN